MTTQVQRRNIFESNEFQGGFQTIYGEDEVGILVNQQIPQINHQERLDQVAYIERSVNEIMDMFSKLANLISIQDYEIERIDQNAQETLSNIEQAKEQLGQYYNKIKGNRGLILKIFMILIIFVLVFILIT